jgi:hypothetical protein
VEIKVRWADCQEEFVNAHNRAEMSCAKANALSQLKLGGILWYGRLADADTTFPLRNAGAGEIRSNKRMPNAKDNGGLWYTHHLGVVGVGKNERS